MGVDGFDDLDRALAHALQLNGRAPFRLLGSVLGVSDQTIARRYARLRRDGVLRVVGVFDIDLLRMSQWVIRVKTTPAAAKSVGAALAARVDTSWVNLCGAGTDIVFAAVGGSAEVLLSDTLAHTKAIVGIQADQVLHTFSGGHTSGFTKRGTLSPDQISVLAEAAPRATTGADEPAPVSVDGIDQQLMTLLREDGRMSIDALAQQVGLSDTSTRRRVDTLLRTGTVRVGVDVDVALLGVPLRAMLWLRADPGTLDGAGAALARHPEVTYAAAVTGIAGLFVSIAIEDASALYEYLSTCLPEVPGVALVESAVVIRHIKDSSAQMSL